MGSKMEPCSCVNFRKKMVFSLSLSRLDQEDENEWLMGRVKGVYKELRDGQNKGKVLVLLDEQCQHLADNMSPQR